jgi:HSP20 family protein
MNDLPARQHTRSWPDLWSELFTGFPAPLKAMHPGHLIKLEDEIEDGRYVLRAELPGIDPEKDVDITVSNGRLTIKAERTEKTEANGRSEFSYGSFARSITLPDAADNDDIKASYDKGILTVSVGLPEPAEPAEKRIPVKAV